MSMTWEEYLAAAGINPALFSEGDHWEKVGKDMLAILAERSAKFVKDNLSDVIGLTEDELKGLLFNAVLETPSLPPAPGEDATMAQLRAYSEITRLRMQAYALTMDAQKQKNIEEAQIEAKAKAFAVDLGGLLLNGVLASVTTAAVSSIAK